MRTVAVLALVLGCCACDSHGAGSRSTTPGSSSTSSPSTSTVSTCAGIDPLTVTRTFVRAAQAHDRATLARCAYRGATLTADDLNSAAAVDLLLPETTERHDLYDLPPGTVGYDVPFPPLSRGTVIINGTAESAGPPYATGMFVILTKHTDGRYYVRDVRNYGSG
jgi:hypothetical protein